MQTLEEKLAYLQQHGKPTLGIYSTGNRWHCGCTLFVPHIGCNVEVKSDYDLTTPTDAVDQCIARLNAMKNGGRQLAPR
jgi:hypothetical protein